MNQSCEKYKNILAVDSSGNILSVAAVNGDDIHYAETDAKMRQSELVMDLIDAQIKKAGLKPAGLDGVLCTGGPGSFTGLRIGYSLAKGLALSLSIPFAAVPTLDCIALSEEQNGTVLAVIEARKNAYFYAFFREERLTPDKDGDPVQIAGEIREFKEKITIIGPGSALLYESLPQDLKDKAIIKHCQKGYAKELFFLAKKRNILDNENTCLYSGPEYIRKTDAEINLNGETGTVL